VPLLKEQNHANKKAGTLEYISKLHIYAYY